MVKCNENCGCTSEGESERSEVNRLNRRNFDLQITWVCKSNEISLEDMDDLWLFR